MTTSPTPDNIHQGRNIKRFREWIGMKQSALASELGEDWTQKKISMLEQKETIDEPLLQQVAKALRVTPELLSTFELETPVTNVNNFNDSSSVQGGFNSNGNSTVNSNIDLLNKWSEAMDNQKQLYERLLAAEKEKYELLRERVGK